MNSEIIVSEVPLKEMRNVLTKTGLLVMFAADQTKAKPDSWMMRAVHADDHSYVAVLHQGQYWMLRLDGGNKAARVERYHGLLRQIKLGTLLSNKTQNPGQLN